MWAEGSSPRTWGCFSIYAKKWFADLVFPTHVGVFPQLLVCSERQNSLPHARGGVSGVGQGNVSAEGLPHARGGVSSFSEKHTVTRLSSPRTWGCFSDREALANSRRVFPTHVGVFLKGEFQLHAGIGLPHARGGVSSVSLMPSCAQASSPRTWGCFTLGAGLSGFGIVFPTHVGGAPSRGCPRKPLPHSWGFSRLPLT